MFNPRLRIPRVAGRLLGEEPADEAELKSLLAPSRPMT
jgi:hypothetical protein